MRPLNKQFIDEITDRVKMSDIFSQYGFQVNRAGFTPCPFHKEKTASLKAFQHDTKFHCFGCGKTGSVIDFVMCLYNLSLNQAVVKINYDFGLNLPIGERLTISKQHELKKSERERKAKLKAQKEQKQQRESEYWKIFDEWKRLDDNMHQYKPKAISEELHPLFAEALQKITYQEFLLDSFDLKGV